MAVWRVETADRPTCRHSRRSGRAADAADDERERDEAEGAILTAHRADYKTPAATWSTK